MWRVKLPNLMTILTASATGGSITEGSLLVQCVVIRTASAEVAALFAVLPGDRAGGNTEGTPSSEAAGGDGWQQDVIVRGQISVFGSSAAAEALLDHCWKHGRAAVLTCAKTICGSGGEDRLWVPLMNARTGVHFWIMIYLFYWHVWWEMWKPEMWFYFTLVLKGKSVESNFGLIINHMWII